MDQTEPTPSDALNDTSLAQMHGGIIVVLIGFLVPPPSAGHRPTGSAGTSNTVLGS